MKITAETATAETAQIPVKSPDVTTVSPTSKHAGYKIDKDRAIILLKGGMAPAKVAEEVGCHKSNIYTMLQRLEQNGQVVKIYRENEAMLIDKVKSEILAKLDHAITKGNIPLKKASEINSMSTAFGILTDKALLVQGKATSIVNVSSYEHSIKELRIMEEKMIKLQISIEDNQ